MTQDVNYRRSVRLSDALYGMKPVLRRNSKGLEVTIPPRTKNGTKIRLRDALRITNGMPGDIIVQIEVIPPPIINPTQGTNIDDVFQTCLYEVGGGDNDHVNGYLDSRNNVIYRQLFFAKAVGAIWGAGLSAKAASTFLGRAGGRGFPSSFSVLAAWSNAKMHTFMQRIHGAVVPPKARQKWEAVHKVATWLNSFQNECDFRQQVFRGLLLGKQSDKQDVSALIDRRLPWIGFANAHYIVRMLGGEQIKDDKWIRALRAWVGLPFDELEQQVSKGRVPLGFFDVVMWEYCNMFVKDVNRLIPHLNSKFGFFLRL